MELLETAVLDVTTLVATCRTLASIRFRNIEDGQRKLRIRLRREIKHSAMVYIDLLARTRHGVVDESRLCLCRVAAERQMPTALVHQHMLRHMMVSEAGSPQGLMAVRQDLWRLALIASYLGIGLVAVKKTSGSSDVLSADVLAAALRRRFRRGLLVYAGAALRNEGNEAQLVMKARAAALAEIGPLGATQAERLADFEADAGASLSFLRLGVTKPLLTLALDWRRPHVVPDDQLSTRAPRPDLNARGQDGFAGRLRHTALAVRPKSRGGFSE